MPPRRPAARGVPVQLQGPTRGRIAGQRALDQSRRRRGLAAPRGRAAGWRASQDGAEALGEARGAAPRRRVRRTARCRRGCGGEGLDAGPRAQRRRGSLKRCVRWRRRRAAAGRPPRRPRWARSYAVHSATARSSARPSGPRTRVGREVDLAPRAPAGSPTDTAAGARPAARRLVEQEARCSARSSRSPARCRRISSAYHDQRAGPGGEAEDGGRPCGPSTQTTASAASAPIVAGVRDDDGPPCRAGPPTSSSSRPSDSQLP